jgi:hypothetical protein
MSKRSLLLLLFVAPALPAQRATLASVSWLNGCWVAKNATRQITERWEVAGSELKGLSRPVRAGVPGEPEILKIFVSGDSLVYGAEPPGQRYSEFRAISVSPTEVVFQNLKHDFPKKITYRLTTKDSLHARVEGDSGSTMRPLNYPYERAACAPDTPTAGEIARGELAPRYADLEAKETVAGSGTNAWMAEHAAPGFQYITWPAGGKTAPVATAEVLARAVESSRTNPAVSALRDRVHTISLDRINVQGDTALMYVTVRRAWKFPDNIGTYGPKGDYHDRTQVERRVDRWVKLASVWKLRESAMVGVELSIDGRVVNRDGVIIPR